MTLSDNQFISQFENLTLDPQYFGHAGHIRICWLYFKLYSKNETRSKVFDGINRYACSLGAKDKFHHTITGALVSIIEHRLEQQSIINRSNWQSFQQCNQDLFDDAIGLMRNYYSEERLNSTEAKDSFLDPDIKALK